MGYASRQTVRRSRDPVRKKTPAPTPVPAPAPDTEQQNLYQLPTTFSAADVLRLQRAIGNRATQRYIQREGEGVGMPVTPPELRSMPSGGSSGVAIHSGSPAPAPAPAPTPGGSSSSGGSLMPVTPEHLRMMGGTPSSLPPASAGISPASTPTSPSAGPRIIEATPGAPMPVTPAELQSIPTGGGSQIITFHPDAPAPVAAPLTASGNAEVTDTQKALAAYQTVSASRSVQGFIKLVTTAAITTTQEATSWVGELMNILDTFAILPGAGLLMNIKATYSSVMRHNALFEAFSASTGTPMAATYEYGLKKVERGLWRNMAATAASMLKLASIILTVATGGAVAVVAIPAMGIAQLHSLSLFATEKVKGIYKWFKNKRGKNRTERATSVYNAARAGDRTALTLMVKTLSGYGNKAMSAITSKVKPEDALPAYPGTPEAMQAFLNEHASKREQKKIITQLADTMKSK